MCRKLQPLWILKSQTSKKKIRMRVICLPYLRPFELGAQIQLKD